jgi:hypothetical protein
MACKAMVRERARRGGRGQRGGERRREAEREVVCVFVCVRERERNEISSSEMLLHKGSIYRTTCVGCKVKNPLKCMWPISYGIPKIT